MDSIHATTFGSHAWPMYSVPLIAPLPVPAEQPTILEGTDLQQQQFNHRLSTANAEGGSRGEHLSDGGFETLDVHHPTPEAIQHHHDQWKQAQQ